MELGVLHLLCIAWQDGLYPMIRPTITRFHQANWTARVWQFSEVYVRVRVGSVPDPDRG